MEQEAARWRACWQERRQAITDGAAALRASPELKSLRHAISQLVTEAVRTGVQHASDMARHVRPGRRSRAGTILIGLVLANWLVWSGLMGSVGWVVAGRVAALPDPAPEMRTLAAMIPIRFEPAAAVNGILPRPTATTVRSAAWLPKAAALPWAPTATAIPIAYKIWEPSLPDESGWSGAGGCAGKYISHSGAGDFVWPTDGHALAGRDFSARWHPGLDLLAELGAPIYAAGSGVVVYAGWNVWGYGNLVIIDHGDGWHTLYAHLSQVDVSCGQAVEQGSVIGLAGSTGRSTGPHLHFEMRNAAGRVNPWAYLP